MSNNNLFLANTNAAMSTEVINMAEKSLKTREVKKKKVEKNVADPTSTVKKSVKKPKKTY